MKIEKIPTWSDIWTAWVKRGFPYDEAAFRADEAMRRRERERFTKPIKCSARLSKKGAR